MTAFLDFTIPRDAFVLGSVLDADAAKRIDLTQFVPVGEDLAPYFWAETADDDAFEAEVIASPHVASLQRLDGESGRTLYRIEWEESVDGLIDNLRRHDVAVFQAGTTDGKWAFTLVAANRGAFSEFQAACRDEEIPLTIRRISDSDDRDSALYGLTKKQREALLLAYNSGYYDEEQNVTLADLSEGLDISQQSLSARLKRGSRVLIANTIVTDEAT